MKVCLDSGNGYISGWVHQIELNWTANNALYQTWPGFVSDLISCYLNSLKKYIIEVSFLQANPDIYLEKEQEEIQEESVAKKRDC